MFTLLLISLAFCAKLSWCYEDGAPPLACITMTPGHIDPIGNNRIPGRNVTTSLYKLHAKWNHDRNLIQVSITGDVLQGFLILGRVSQAGIAAVGQFVNINKTEAQYLDCELYQFENKSSLTHINKNEKKNMVFYWKPPVNQTGNVTFLATLAKTKLHFWVEQKSNPVPLIMPERTPSSAGSKTASAIFALQSIILVMASRVLLS